MRLDAPMEPPPDRHSPKCTGPPVQLAGAGIGADEQGPEPPGSSGSPVGKPGAAHQAPRYPIATLAKLGRAPERSVSR